MLAYLWVGWEATQAELRLSAGRVAEAAARHLLGAGSHRAWALRLLYWEDGCSTGLSPKVERERCPHSQGIGLQKQLSSLGQLGQGEWGLFPEGHMFNIWGRWSLQYSSVAGRREV